MSHTEKLYCTCMHAAVSLVIQSILSSYGSSIQSLLPVLDVKLRFILLYSSQSRPAPIPCHDNQYLQAAPFSSSVSVTTEEIR